MTEAKKHLLDVILDASAECRMWVVTGAFLGWGPGGGGGSN